MDVLLDYIRSSYYTNLLAAIIAFVTAIKIQRKEGKVNSFVVYLFLFSLNQVLFYLGILLFHGSFIYSEIRIGLLYYDFAFTIFEYFVFYSFIRNNLKNYTSTYILEGITGIYCVVNLILIADFIRSSANENSLHSAFLVQAIFLLILCIIYFSIWVQRIEKKASEDKRQFWIIAGISFFSICTIPYSLFINQIFSVNVELYRNLFSIYFLFYIVLFLLLVKGHNYPQNGSVVQQSKKTQWNKN